MQDIVMKADLVIFQRNMVVPQAYDAMEYYQGMGKPVVVDLDDAYQILPWSNPAHAFWIENSQKIEQNPVVILEEGLRRSNGLIAPNRLLLSDWKHVTRGYYLPNFARGEWWSKVITREEAKQRLSIKNRIVIGWGGSVSHYDSWWGSGIKEAAKRISMRHPEVLWLICGNDKRIYEQLPVPWSSKSHQVGVAPQDWPNVVASFDIGVAPLYGPYDQRRSWIKGLEYTLAAVPWIGTAGEPYSDIVNLGTVIQNNEDNWEIALESMIANLKRKQDESLERRIVGYQWFAENQQDTYERVYKEIISSFSSVGRLSGIAYVQPEEKKSENGV